MVVAESRAEAAYAADQAKPEAVSRNQGHESAKPEILSGAQIACRSLELEGVTTLFGYPGGAVIPLYDAIASAKFHHVLVRFEQWAGMAAEPMRA